MSIILAADLNTFLDNYVSAYRKVLGTSAAAFGMSEPGGAYGAATPAAALLTTLQGISGNADPIIDLGAASQNLLNGLSSIAVYGNISQGVLTKLDQHVKARGSYKDLDTYLTYLNTGAGGPWAALQHPDFRAIYNQIKRGSNFPKNYNLYFEVLQGTTYTNALAKWVVTGAGTGTRTSGFSVDSAKYAGGVPYIVVSSFAGSSGVVTVTGTAFDPVTKTTIAGVTWTATVTANNTYALSVGTAPANSQIIAVSAISAAAAITGGTIYVEAHRPSGRPLL